jgi:hypothetical protein
MEPAPVYLQLREAITKVVPGDHGMAPSPELPHVWGVMVDVGLPPGPVTLVAIADTTTSFYLGSGGATVGVGGVPDIAEKARELLRRVEAALPAFAPIWEFPVPPIGGVQLLALTYQGMFAVRSTMERLERPGDPLGPAWWQTGVVVGAIQELERRAKDRRAGISGS